MRAAAAGRLVLLDTYYPGWQADVDDHRTSIDAADGAFESVSVPTGAHVVRFSFAPSSVSDGEILTLVALALALVGLVFGGGRLAWMPAPVGRIKRR